MVKDYFSHFSYQNRIIFYAAIKSFRTNMYEHWPSIIYTAENSTNLYKYWRTCCVANFTSLSIQMWIKTFLYHILMLSVILIYCEQHDDSTKTNDIRSRLCLVQRNCLLDFVCLKNHKLSTFMKWKFDQENSMFYYFLFFISETESFQCIFSS
jgi:hypothetical protein